jgi:hypothetical protein
MSVPLSYRVHSIYCVPYCQYVYTRQEMWMVLVLLRSTCDIILTKKLSHFLTF